MFIIGQQQLLICVWIEFFIQSPIFGEQHSNPEFAITPHIFVWMCVVVLVVV